MQTHRSKLFVRGQASSPHFFLQLTTIIPEHSLCGTFYPHHHPTVVVLPAAGSGKTYTMMGEIEDEQAKGVVPRLVTEFFHRLDVVKAHTGRFEAFFGLVNWPTSVIRFFPLSVPALRPRLFA